MNPDRRAEIGPQNGLSQEPRTKGSGNLPRWARSPILAARLTLAALTGLGAAVGVDGVPIASAQTACKGTEREFTVVGMQVPFLDMAKIVPAGDRKSIFDKGIDPYLEMPALGGQLKVVEPTSKKELSSSNFTTQPPRIPNVQLPHLDENLAWAVGRWCATPNITMTLKDGRRVPAVEVIIKSSQHPENESYRVTVPAGGILPNWFGREVKKPTDFLDMADKKVAPVRDLDAKKEKLIRDWLAAQKVAATGVVTPTAASRTSTATYTEEVRAALEKAMTERLDKAISPLQGDLRSDLLRQKDSIDELSKRTKSLEDKQGKTERELAEIKGRLPAAAPVPRPGEGINLPAKVVDLVTEPDTQFPLRAGIGVLALLVVLSLLKRVPKVGIVAIPGAYILGTTLYPIRYVIARRKHNRNVAAAVAGGPVPAWTRPTFTI